MHVLFKKLSNCCRHISVTSQFHDIFKTHCAPPLFLFNITAAAAAAPSAAVGIITKFARVNLQMYQGHLALFKTICNDFVTLKDVVINIDDDSSLHGGSTTRDCRKCKQKIPHNLIFPQLAEVRSIFCHLTSFSYFACEGFVAKTFLVIY